VNHLVILAITLTDRGHIHLIWTESETDRWVDLDIDTARALAGGRRRRAYAWVADAGGPCPVG
jgi:hypothetical protein